MLKFAANLSFLYQEHAFLDRFAAAAQDGFRGVEFLFPYAWPAGELRQRLRDNDLEQVLFNAPPGDWGAGERGMACVPGRQDAFREGFGQALSYAEALGCRRIHVMAGLCPAGVDDALLRDTYDANLAWAADAAAASGCMVLIEPINLQDMPGYFLSSQAQARQVLARLDRPNLKIQLDLYHCQKIQGNLSATVTHGLMTGEVAHFQVASVPDRAEPTTGEVNDDHVFDLIETLSGQVGWEGWIGCEYRPRLGNAPGATTAGLGWLRARGASSGADPAKP